VETGDLITLWTARFAMALYAFALAVRYCPGPHRRTFSLARWLWTAGLVVFLVHVACAFHFHHGWSHAHAYQFTADATYDAVGWHWGGGLYANYAFALVWLADAAWWWTRPHRYESRPRWIHVAIHAFMAFMAINSSVVFARAAGRIWAIGVMALAALAAFRCSRA
jgi:hypothetical protein